VHFIAFAALTFPLACMGRYGLLPVFIGASASGGAIELIQPSFNRSSDLNDWVADVVGVVLGIDCGFIGTGKVLLSIVKFKFDLSKSINTFKL
jgi:VanZ family protein